MNLLINCSNLKAGGGLQVADSVCGQLSRFSQHHFFVVLSPSLRYLEKRMTEINNVEVFIYEIPQTLKVLLLGRDSFLDKIVVGKRINAVLTIFGPSLWRPQVKHLCGFARAQLLLTDSPYYKRLSYKERCLFKLWKWLFKRCADCFYTENQYISDLLPELLGKVKVFTVTNYYNQVYDHPERWDYTRDLPPYDGVTALSVSTHYPHKNFEILIDVARYLVNTYPDFRIRFVLTFDSDEMQIPDELKSMFLFIGKVDISECPHLYEQSDIMFMPTLMECFTATYPEAMRMGKPIVTTDLEFAKGLCGEAACYYNAVDSKAAAEALFWVATDKNYYQLLVDNGKKQLHNFDDYEQRAEKLVKILETI